MKMLRGILGGWTLLWACATLPAFAQQTGGGAIKTSDLVYVEVYRHPELSTTGQVDGNGNLSLPYVGNVNLAGLTEKDASERVTAALTKILKNPRATVSRSASPTAPSAYRKTEMRTEIVPLENANAEQLSRNLQNISSEGGSVSFDPDTNSLIVTDSPEAINNILSIIQRLDQMQSQLTQVRIEAKIAEVQIGAMKELGVRWFVQGEDLLGGYYAMPTQTVGINALRGSQADPMSNEHVGGLNGNNVGNLGRQYVNNGKFDRRLNAPVHVPKAGQIFLGGLRNGIDIGVMLDALVADNKAQLLANPNVLTVNHKKAEIRSTEEFPYTEYGTELSGVATFSTKFIDTGIKLAVTPHVYEFEGSPCVRLELAPEVSSTVGTSNGIPIRSVRSSSGEARVRDGQTLVIGGIYRNDSTNVEQRVPGLGSIPVVGNLFKRTERAKVQTELMVFVTPTVHPTPDTVTWDRMLDVSAIAAESKASKAVAPDTPRENRKD
ncbi:MAG TPA: polysaccharide biosynthesis/export family protein [Candidatus Hydrogenedentes bacterium]|nr:polysaccharide biosynthesis/export family protein [Candidatus Hydrogenedentota bacterium]